MNSTEATRGSIQARPAKHVAGVSGPPAVRPWSAWIDVALLWLKWPAALLAVIAVPRLVVALGREAQSLAMTPWWLLWFLAGFFGFLAFWGWLGRVLPKFPRWAMTFEHEFTHALLAWLTLHRVTGLRASWRGGHMSFQGQGNWLITLAPYFFPTLCLLVPPAGLLMPWPLSPLVQALLGAALAYHLASTYHELHREQTDLQQTGWIFCLLVLPSANLLAWASVLAYAHGGLSGCVKLWLGLGSF